jgi:hypothetical protein
VRVRLKGINSRRKKLADGSFKTYYWAWKGGPPLRGKAGSPEFIASYNETVAEKIVPPRGKLLSEARKFAYASPKAGARLSFRWVHHLKPSSTRLQSARPSY